MSGPALEARDILHVGGVSDRLRRRGFVSSDEDAWRRLHRRGGKPRITAQLRPARQEQLRASCDASGEQARPQTLGFYRTPRPRRGSPSIQWRCSARYELFEEYAASRDIAADELLDVTGLKMQHVRSVLTNRIYNGWAVRERRSPRSPGCPRRGATHRRSATSCSGAASRTRAVGASRPPGVAILGAPTCSAKLPLVSMRARGSMRDAYEQAGSAVPALPARSAL